MKISIPKILEKCPEKLITALDQILNAAFILFLGGRFCGKTQFAARVAVHLMEMYSGFKVVWGRGIKDRLGESARPMFKRLIEAEGITIIQDSEESLTLANGSMIRFRAFNMERGLDANGLDDVDLLIVDEAQKMSQNTVDNVIDSIRNESGTTAKWFITNPFTMTDPVEMVVNDYDGLKFHLTYLDNKACPKDKFEEAEKLKINNPSAYRRRMLGFPDVSDPNSLLQPVDFDFDVPEDELSCLLAGYDPAGDSGDQNCLWILGVLNSGFCIEKEVINWSNLDEMQSVAKVVEIIKNQQISAITVDAVGLGSGVYSRLVELLTPYGVKVFQFKSNNTSTDQKLAKTERDRIFYNIRQEVHKKNFKIKDSKTIYELTATHFTSDSGGFIKIEDKKSIKKTIHHSPNNSDACAMALYCRQKYNLITRTQTGTINQAWIKQQFPQNKPSQRWF